MYNLSPRSRRGSGVDQLSGKTGPELLQGAGFCDVSWKFIPIPDGAWKEWIEMGITVGSLLEKSPLASCSAITWPHVAGALDIH